MADRSHSSINLSPQTLDASNELERLAEADGAILIRSATGAWWAKDKDGISIVRGALSRAEAARLYCEDKDLVGSSPEAILAYIKAQYRPHDTMPEFQEGFDAYRKTGSARRDPYEGVKGQAWDRGANAAMLYARALSLLDKPPAVIEDVQPTWLAKLLQRRASR